MAVWIYPKKPDPLIIPKGGTVLCGSRADGWTGNWASKPGTWTVGSGLSFTWGSGTDRVGGLELHSDGIYTGDSWVSCVSEGGTATRDVIIVEPEYMLPEPFTDLRLIDTTWAEIGILSNHSLVDLIITRELSGIYSVEFELPYDAPYADSITRGVYVKAEGSYFMIDRIEHGRTAENIPTIRVFCVHEFFETRHMPTAWSRDYYSHFFSQYRLALFQTAHYDLGDPPIVPCGLDSTNEYYFIDRYVESIAERSRLESFKLVFNTFGGDFYLWRNYAIVLPYEEVLTASNVTLSYSVTNHSIKRTIDETNLFTHLYGYGGTGGTELDPLKRSVQVQASELIRNLYRVPRIGFVDFGDVTSDYELNYMAVAYMTMLERTRIAYELTVADLQRLPYETTENFSIDIGKVVNVTDTDLGINHNVRITRYSYKPLEPETPAQIMLGSKLQRMHVPKTPYEGVSYYGASSAKDTGLGTPSGATEAPRRPAQLIVSTDPPEFSRGNENDIWIQYDDGTGE